MQTTNGETTQGVAPPMESCGDPWLRLTPHGSLRLLTYSFGPGSANTLAVRLEDGGWLVVSPSLCTAESAFAALEAEGPVRALLAPNAYHHRGQAEWRARFPGAISYAPDGALQRLRWKSTVTYQPVQGLVPLLPEHLEIVLPDGQKSPDLLVRAGSSWWLGDLFSNLAAGDQSWPLRLVSRLAGSGLGYRRNTRPGLVYVRDEAAWLRSVRQALELHPPGVAIPAHGAPITENAAAQTLALVQSPAA
jgi:hypothetical protein